MSSRTTYRDETVAETGRRVLTEYIDPGDPFLEPYGEVSLFDANGTPLGVVRIGKDRAAADAKHTEFLALARQPRGT